MRRFLMMVTILAGSDALAGEWKRLPSLPDKEGFAGPFAGVSNGALIVAGGAKFPDKKPWEGGKKVWYDTVFVLEKPNGEWKVAGKLPRPLGYGVSVTHGTGVVCVGGGDMDRHYADVFRLDWKDGKLVTTKLPSLPKPLANACGALVGDTLYVAGGQEKPDATETLKMAWTIDLAAAEPKWQEIDAWPGTARMLSVAAGYDGAFWLVGGTDLFVGKGNKVERRYLKDAYRFDPDKGWKRIADLPHPVVVTAAPFPPRADRCAHGLFTFSAATTVCRSTRRPTNIPGSARKSSAGTKRRRSGPARASSAPHRRRLRASSGTRCGSCRTARSGPASARRKYGVGRQGKGSNRPLQNSSLRCFRTVRGWW